MKKMGTVAHLILEVLERRNMRRCKGNFASLISISGFDNEWHLDRRKKRARPWNRDKHWSLTLVHLLTARQVESVVASYVGMWPLARHASLITWQPKTTQPCVIFRDSKGTDSQGVITYFSLSPKFDNFYCEGCMSDAASWQAEAH